ncbi:RES family NAD+ phosphorylase [Mycobacterium sp. KBS0706]|uniref:RES family NAD+ phosphorylase n=1 Tax=Mycobacterium sp. KBS0706 TaxID=2578109 RepID=UPI001C8FA0D3|nr:RES family NAD+ phosphorylase [Mycobacterium sp. KBS0706]
MADLSYPVERLALQRTVRLVSTARLRDPVLLGLVAGDQLGDLEEIESATSGRLVAKRQGTDGIAADEFIGSHPHANFINAAFAYFRPRALNRFNGPGRGAWYAAFTTETCLREVVWHITRELDYVREYRAVVEYAELFASFAGEFIDLRGVTPSPACLDPDPEIGYPHGNALADSARAAGYNGIIYPSVRDPEGTCLVALWPHAVQSVAQGAVWRVSWSGNREPDISQATA